MRKISVPQSYNKPTNSIDNMSEIFSDKEKLWKYFFGSEYKPEISINFQKIKNQINKLKEEDNNYKFRNYNYNLGSLLDLCDYIIQNNPGGCTLTFLESLSKNQKRCLSDMFLNLLPFPKIQELMGMAMLFWIRHYGYYYSSYREEKLREYLIDNSNLLASEEDFNKLERSFEAQSKIHGNGERNIVTTLLGFIIEKNLQNDLQDLSIKQYLEQKLGGEFSFQKFTPRNNKPLGIEEDRDPKDIDREGYLINPEKIRQTSKYIKIKLLGDVEKNIEVPNYDNNDIYTDWSGKLYKIYLDGPLSFGLFHKNDPISIICFSIKDPETIFINQMQTIPSENFDKYGRMISQSVNPVVHTINRQETTYDVVNILAHKYGFKNIIIQSGENNKRIHEHRKIFEYDDEQLDSIEKETKIPHLSKDIAKKIYDNFAKNHGFKKEKESKNWQKKI